jgi:hypothetical protein
MHLKASFDTYLCGRPLPLGVIVPLPSKVVNRIDLCGRPLPSGVIGGSIGSAKDTMIHPEPKVRATSNINTRDATFIHITSFARVFCVASALFYQFLSRIL